MREQIDAFLNYLNWKKKASANTLAAYRNDLNQFVAFIEAKSAGKDSNSMWVDFNRDLLPTYFYNLRERNYAAATVARKIAAVKSFFTFMKETGRLDDNLAKAVTSPKVPKKIPRTLSQSEVSRLLLEPSKSSTPEAKRDVAMLKLLYATGLRVSELMSLNFEDIDLKTNLVRCRGAKARTLPIDKRLAKIIKEYVEASRFELLQKENERALFLNRRGERLTRQGFWQILKAYAEKAGIESEVTPQIIRHSFALHKLKEGITLESLQKFLGHTHISTTREYERVK